MVPLTKRQKIQFFFIVPIMLTIIGIVSSCYNKDDFDFDKLASVEWEGTYVIPILYGDMTLDEVDFDDDEVKLKSYNNGLLYLSYEHLEVSDDVREHYTLNNTSSGSQIATSSITFSGTAANDMEIMSKSFIIPVNTADANLDTIIFNSLTSNFSLVSTINAQLKIIISLPSALDQNNNPVSMEYMTNASGDINPAKQNTLTNVLIVTNNGGRNKIPVEVTAILPAGQTATITLASDFSFKLDLIDQDFRYMSGYFIPDQLEIEGDVDIDVFENLFEGSEFALSEGKLYLEIVNEIGVKQSLDFQELSALYNGGKINLNIDVATPYDVNFPVKPGTTTKDTIEVTNAVEVFNAEPTRFYYNISTKMNDGVSESGTFNFVADTSKMLVNIIVEVPLVGYAKDIVLEDTVELDIDDDISDEVDIPFAALKTRLTNEFPIDATIQVYFMDENYHIIDSLFTEDQTNIVKGSEVNSQGELVSPGTFDDEIILSEDKTDRFFDASYMYILGKLKTSGSDNAPPANVKFYDDYSLSIDMGLRATAKFQLNPNDDE